MSRFKTELCNNLMELGSCKYGDRCHYAHGTHELRQVSRRHPKYRTEKCKNFELTGKCPFGPRCSYVHPRPDLDSMIEQLTRYVQHTKAPKPDSEDDEDETNISNILPRTATCSSLLSQSESSTSCNSNHQHFFIDEINKENQPVASYLFNNRPSSQDNLIKPEGANLSYYEIPFAMSIQQPSILETHKPLTNITHNQQEQQQRPRLASSTLTIQRPQQPQRIAMRALSSNSQSQFIDQAEATKNSIAPPSPSSSSPPPFDKTITSSNLFGIDNPLSDYFRNTRASSYTISNASKFTQNHSVHQSHRTSIIDLILDPSLAEVLTTPSIESNSIEISNSESMLGLGVNMSNRKAAAQQERSVCTLLGNILSGNQMQYCFKHEKLLTVILPQILDLARSECIRITADLRWTCKSMAPFLDRSSFLAFTREAALIRSLLNASMMYLIITACEGHSYRSCGCGADQMIQQASNLISKPEQNFSGKSGNLNRMPHGIIDHVELTPSDMAKLETGSLLRLSRPIVQRQGCNVNVAFADALTRILLDADDTKLLNKAYKILNEDHNKSKGSKFSSEKRLSDSDLRDLSFIRWTKSAVNLHNNHVGRQIVRRSTQKYCRCHGLSGACQYQTCWDKLQSFSEITSSLRKIYMAKSFWVNIRHLGSPDEPDLALSKVSKTEKYNFYQSTINETISKREIDRLGLSELAYLHESPDYCAAQPIIEHRGTENRLCILNTPTKLDPNHPTSGNISNLLNDRVISEELAGSCTYLCCDRGFRSEIVLYVAECNCGFKFCCKVECQNCLRQRMRHYCS